MVDPKCTDLHVKIQNISVGYIPDPHVGKGHGAPPQILPLCPLALRLTLDLQPLNRLPNVC